MPNDTFRTPSAMCKVAACGWVLAWAWALSGQTTSRNGSTTLRLTVWPAASILVRESPTAWTNGSTQVAGTTSFVYRARPSSESTPSAITVQVADPALLVGVSSSAKLISGRLDFTCASDEREAVCGGAQSASTSTARLVARLGGPDAPGAAGSATVTWTFTALPATSSAARTAVAFYTFSSV